MTTPKQAELGKLIESIKQADYNQVESQMEIARILAAIHEYKLYKPKYDTFKQLVQFELDFALHSAQRYVSLHKRYVEFGYGREEFLKLMRQFGWRKVQLALRSSKKRMGYRAIKNFLEDNYYAQDRQYNFNLSSDAAAKKLDKVLASHGLGYSENGRRLHLTDALESLLVDYEKLKKQSAKLPGKKRAKKVA